jgi:hypothetical protein
MAAVRTEAQREASRINGSRSRGPATEEGKRNSRRGGLRDGRFAESVAPDDWAADLEAKAASYEQTFRPRNAHERELVQTAALAQVRVERLQRVELAAGSTRVRAATRDWDHARADAADALLGRLDAEPLRAVRLLLRTSEGCDRLAGLWQTLAAALEQSGAWDEAQTRTALRLSGLDAPPNPFEWPELAEVFDHARALRAHADGSGDPADRPGRDSALAAVREFVAGEIARLEAHAEGLWEQFDGPERDAAPVLALFDTSDDGRKLRRALADAERLRRRALAELASLRAGEPEPRPPAAAPPAEPTPAPRVAGPPRGANPAPSPPRPPRARSEPEPYPPAPIAPARKLPPISLDDILAEPRSAPLPIAIVPSRRS